jgi:WhiB family redox-sensing transcriptional regulator
VGVTVFSTKGTADDDGLAPLHGCPVMGECRDYALEHDEDGFWWNTSPGERRRLRRRAVA